MLCLAPSCASLHSERAHMKPLLARSQKIQPSLVAQERASLQPLLQLLEMVSITTAPISGRLATEIKIEPVEAAFAFTSACSSTRIVAASRIRKGSASKTLSSPYFVVNKIALGDSRLLLASPWHQNGRANFLYKAIDFISWIDGFYQIFPWWALLNLNWQPRICVHQQIPWVCQYVWWQITFVWWKLLLANPTWGTKTV